MEKVDAVVVGAGVIGMAAARALCLAGRSVIVVERHANPGTETSSRNSGVIHSGIYYPPGSAKARFCVRGKALLYEYCAARHVEFRQCGKLIVAQAHQLAKLQSLLQTAVSNDVTDLTWLDGAKLRHVEPEVRASAGLWCPGTGIVSAHDLIHAMQADIESNGGLLAFRTEFLEARTTVDGFEVSLLADGDAMSLSCTSLVNSAGLASTALLTRIDGYPRAQIPVPHFAKGNYFEFSGRSPFRHLVYPMPGEAGLGVHATLDLGGQLRFGPDVEWLDGAKAPFDYVVDPARAGGFYASIREYWPALPDDSLRPSYSGIRPKIVGAGSPAADFRIESARDHGVSGLINLLGMESPGLTASLAVAEQVVKLLD